MNQALSYATTKCLCNILFISDCLNVVNFLKGHMKNILWTNYQLTQICCVTFCHLLLLSADVVWVSHQFNTIAHDFAYWSGCTFLFVWEKKMQDACQRKSHSLSSAKIKNKQINKHPNPGPINM